MRGSGYSFAGLIALAIVAGPASACLPPPPGWVPPTEEERVRSAATWATDIVYGEVTRSIDSGQIPRFRILHVYKGSLRPEVTITALPGWGLNPPMCVGMFGGPPGVPRGARGVIAFIAAQPELNFLSDRELELMFAGGFIRPLPADERRPR